MKMIYTIAVGKTDVTWAVPEDLKSGTYAAYFTQDEEWFYVPFYVRPGKSTRKNAKKNKLCLLVATASYYAYVNNQMPVTWGPVLEHSSTMFYHSDPGRSPFESPSRAWIKYV